MEIKILEIKILERKKILRTETNQGIHTVVYTLDGQVRANMLGLDTLTIRDETGNIIDNIPRDYYQETIDMTDDELIAWIQKQFEDGIF